MTIGSLGLRTSGSNGSLHQQVQNGGLPSPNSYIPRKPSKTSLNGSREKEKFFPSTFRYLSRTKVGMLILVVLALLAFMTGFFTVNREDDWDSSGLPFDMRYPDKSFDFSSLLPGNKAAWSNSNSEVNKVMVCNENAGWGPSLDSLNVGNSSTPATLSTHPCKGFAFSPPPPGERRRIGPRPCPVCYVPVEQAIARMPRLPSASPVLRHLTYFSENNSSKTEPHGGSDFGGYPSLKQRNDSFNITESMTVHCGFIKGCRPGYQTGFDIDVADLRLFRQSYEVIVASAIFGTVEYKIFLKFEILSRSDFSIFTCKYGRKCGSVCTLFEVIILQFLSSSLLVSFYLSCSGNYDVIQQPMNIGEAARNNVPFFMFIDEETEAYMKNTSLLGNNKQVGLWRIIVVRNVPYTDARRNGKVPKLLLHRLFPNTRFSIWIDGKLQLVVDPYQVLERFLWRENATFAISRHYSRFDVFKEAEANKVGGKYNNVSIDHQIEFYKKEGLTPYTAAKLPITSDVPEGCVLIREHNAITNLFGCLWFNEVDRFTSRDQLSFSTVRDKVLAKVKWHINMFLDCERRNFVIQAYHRELLEQRVRMTIIRNHSPPTVPREKVLPKRTPVRTPVRHNREKRPAPKRRRKGNPKNKENSFI